MKIDGLVGATRGQRYHHTDRHPERNKHTTGRYVDSDCRYVGPHGRYSNSIPGHIAAVGGHGYTDSRHIDPL